MTGTTTEGRHAAEPAAVALTKPDAPAALDRVQGRIDISDRVVSKIAARAAVELPNVGAAAPRVLGLSMGSLSSRSTDLDAVPKCDATVDGDHAFLSLTVSIRWPESVPDTCRQLREHLSTRVQALTGLSVRDIDVNVDVLVTEQPRTEARVE